ncbi:precorrin-8X methylmutase [Deferribacteres bacterium DY0037]
MDKGLKIESDSFDIIENMIDLSEFSEMERLIVKKLVHTTGDPEFAELTVISDGGVNSGVQALKAGKPVICDVTMVTAGITKRYLEKCGVEVLCFINHPDVLRISKETNQTRSEVAMEYAAAEYPDAVYAIGNAPTALFRLLELKRGGKVDPSFIAGLPVGFVKAAESKEELAKSDIPYVTNRGTKGGSPCAATVINGLLTLAAQ